ncbi:helix-turn-helix domain-containing protein [Streptomyces sp. NPDC058664]|uniref:helix-turn-helix domain-containing protein n=1 Tax=Streptomyces sp. NPDC058664 TaxID=3346585 RepID=UPI003654FF0D
MHTTPPLADHHRRTTHDHRRRPARRARGRVHPADPEVRRAQVRYLVKQHHGSTKEVAQLLGVSQRTVERYVRDQIKSRGPTSRTGWPPRSAAAGSRR